MSSLELLRYAAAPKLANIAGVEMFGVINKQGRMIDFWGKKALDLTKERRDIFLMQIVLQKSMQQDFDEEFGDVSYCTTYRGKTKIIHFPFEDNRTVLIVASKRANDKTVIDRVRRFLCPPRVSNPKKGGANK